MLSLLWTDLRCSEGLVCTPGVSALPSPQSTADTSPLVQDSSTPHHSCHSPYIRSPCTIASRSSPQGRDMAAALAGMGFRPALAPPGRSMGFAGAGRLSRGHPAAPSTPPHAASSRAHPWHPAPHYVVCHQLHTTTLRRHAAEPTARAASASGPTLSPRSLPPDPRIPWQGKLFTAGSLLLAAIIAFCRSRIIDYMFGGLFLALGLIALTLL